MPVSYGKKPRTEYGKKPIIRTKPTKPKRRGSAPTLPSQGRGRIFPDKDLRARVVAALRENPEGLTLSDISRTLLIDWETAGRYANLLEFDEGIAQSFRVGNARLVKLKAR